MSAPTLPPVDPQAPQSTRDRASRNLWGAVVLPTPEPEPIEWGPHPTFRQRVVHALAMPAVLGGLIFLVVLVGTIATFALKSHTPAAGDEFTPAQQLGAENADRGPTIDANDASATASTDSLVVHVIGEVQAPGVYELSADARLHEAIEAAGGFTAVAAASSVNLARSLTDGEQISVLSEEAFAELELQPPAPSSGGAPSGGDDGIINLNTASAGELEALPRIGPAIAERIIEWREAHGGFGSVDDLLAVSGIGAKTLEGFRDRVRV